MLLQHAVPSGTTIHKDFYQKISLLLPHLIKSIFKYIKPKKKVIRFSDTFFSKIRCVPAAFYFYFYFPFGYILGYLGLA